MMSLFCLLAVSSEVNNDPVLPFGKSLITLKKEVHSEEGSIFSLCENVAAAALL